MRQDVVRLGAERTNEVTDVLCESFYDYPVMRFVVGEVEDYEARLHTLVHFFVMARVFRNEPMLGVRVGAETPAVALVSYPKGEPSDELEALRESVWRELGSDARERYDAFAAACAPLSVEAWNTHLNMIGVRRAHRGTGLGRALLEHVHRMSMDDPASCGVTLTTENPNNVMLYESFGYRILGSAQVAPGLTTWGFFRPDEGGSTV